MYNSHFDQLDVRNFVDLKGNEPKITQNTTINCAKKEKKLMKPFICEFVNKTNRSIISSAL